MSVPFLLSKGCIEGEYGIGWSHSKHTLRFSGEPVLSGEMMFGKRWAPKFPASEFAQKFEFFLVYITDFSQNSKLFGKMCHIDQIWRRIWVFLRLENTYSPSFHNVCVTKCAFLEDLWFFCIIKHHGRLVIFCYSLSFYEKKCPAFWLPGSRHDLSTILPRPFSSSLPFRFRLEAMGRGWYFPVAIRAINPFQDLSAFQQQ